MWDSYGFSFHHTCTAGIPSGNRSPFTGSTVIRRSLAAVRRLARESVPLRPYAVVMTQANRDQMIRTSAGLVPGLIIVGLGTLALRNNPDVAPVYAAWQLCPGA